MADESMLMCFDGETNFLDLPTDEGSDDLFPALDLQRKDLNPLQKDMICPQQKEMSHCDNSFMPDIQGMSMSSAEQQQLFQPQYKTALSGDVITQQPKGNVDVRSFGLSQQPFKLQVSPVVFSSSGCGHAQNSLNQEFQHVQYLPNSSQDQMSFQRNQILQPQDVSQVSQTATPTLSDIVSPVTMQTVTPSPPASVNIDQMFPGNICSDRHSHYQETISFQYNSCMQRDYIAQVTEEESTISQSGAIVSSNRTNQMNLTYANQQSQSDVLTCHSPAQMEYSSYTVKTHTQPIIITPNSLLTPPLQSPTSYHSHCSEGSTAQSSHQYSEQMVSSYTSVDIPLQQLIQQSSSFPSAISSFPSQSSNFPSASFNFPSASSNFPSASSNFPSASSNFPSASSNFPSASSNFPSASSNFPSGSSNFPSASSNFPSASSAAQDEQVLQDLLYDTLTFQTSTSSTLNMQPTCEITVGQRCMGAQSSYKHEEVLIPDLQSNRPQSQKGVIKHEKSSDIRKQCLENVQIRPDLQNNQMRTINPQTLQPNFDQYQQSPQTLEQNLHQYQQSPQTLQQNLDQYQQSLQTLQQNLNQYQQSPQTLQQYVNQYQQGPQTLQSNLNQYQQSPQTLQPNLNQDQQNPQILQQNLNHYQQSPQTLQPNLNQDQQNPQILQQNLNQYQQGPQTLQPHLNHYQQSPQILQQKPHILQHNPQTHHQSLNHFQQTPHLFQQTPHLFQQTPHLFQQTPHLFQQTPLIPQVNLSQIQQVPQMLQVDLSLVQQSPQMCQVNPGLVQQSPQMCQVNPGLVQQSPQMCQVNPGLVQQSPRMCQVNPGLFQQSPQMCQVNPGLVQQNPQMCQVNPGLVQQNPQMCQVNPGLVQQNPQMTPVIPYGNQQQPQIPQANPSTIQQHPQIFVEDPHQVQQKSNQHDQNLHDSERKLSMQQSHIKRRRVETSCSYPSIELTEEPTYMEIQSCYDRALTVNKPSDVGVAIVNYVIAKCQGPRRDSAAWLACTLREYITQHFQEFNSLENITHGDLCKNQDFIQFLKELALVGNFAVSDLNKFQEFQQKTGNNIADNRKQMGPTEIMEKDQEQIIFQENKLSELNKSIDICNKALTEQDNISQELTNWSSEIKKLCDKFQANSRLLKSKQIPREGSETELQNIMNEYHKLKNQEEIITTEINKQVKDNRWQPCLSRSCRYLCDVMKKWRSLEAWIFAKLTPVPEKMEGLCAELNAMFTKYFGCVQHIVQHVEKLQDNFLEIGVKSNLCHVKADLNKMRNQVLSIAWYFEQEPPRCFITTEKKDLSLRLLGMTRADIDVAQSKVYIFPQTDFEIRFSDDYLCKKFHPEFEKCDNQAENKGVKVLIKKLELDKNFQRTYKQGSGYCFEQLQRICLNIKLSNTGSTNLECLSMPFAVRTGSDQLWECEGAVRWYCFSAHDLYTPPLQPDWTMKTDQVLCMLQAIIKTQDPNKTFSRDEIHSLKLLLQIVSKSQDDTITLRQLVKEHMPVQGSNGRGKVNKFSCFTWFTAAVNSHLLLKKCKMSDSRVFLSDAQCQEKVCTVAKGSALVRVSWNEIEGHTSKTPFANLVVCIYSETFMDHIRVAVNADLNSKPESFPHLLELFKDVNGETVIKTILPWQIPLKEFLVLVAKDDEQVTINNYRTRFRKTPGDTVLLEKQFEDMNIYHEDRSLWHDT